MYVIILLPIDSGFVLCIYKVIIMIAWNCDSLDHIGELIKATIGSSRFFIICFPANGEWPIRLLDLYRNSVE